MPKPNPTSISAEVWSFGSLLLELYPETEYYRSRRVRDAGVRIGLAEPLVAHVQRVGLVVGSIEHVEDFEHTVQRHRPDRNPLLQPKVHTMDRILDEVVARDDDRARNTQSRNAASHVEPRRTQTP